VPGRVAVAPKQRAPGRAESSVAAVRSGSGFDPGTKSSLWAPEGAQDVSSAPSRGVYRGSVASSAPWAPPGTASGARGAWSRRSSSSGSARARQRPPGARGRGWNRASAGPERRREGAAEPAPARGPDFGPRRRPEFDAPAGAATAVAWAPMSWTRAGRAAVRARPARARRECRSAASSGRTAASSSAVASSAAVAAAVRTRRPLAHRATRASRARCDRPARPSDPSAGLS